MLLCHHVVLEGLIHATLASRRELLGHVEAEPAADPDEKNFHFARSFS